MGDGNSSGITFPTIGINPGHIHLNTLTGRSFMYKGGDPTDTVNNWTEVDLADGPDIFVKKDEGTAGVNVDSIPSGSVVTLMKMMSRILSHGLISGGTITDNGDGTVTVAAGEGTIRPSDNKLVDLVYTIWEQSDPITIPDNDNKQIVVDYNNGNPQVIAVDDYATEAERRDRIYLGEVHNASGVLTIDMDPEVRGDFTHLIQEWAENLINIRVASGESVSETGTRNLIVTAGVIWGRHFDDHDTPAIDTSSSDTFIAFYRSATPGQYTRVTGQTQWNNTQYDDGSGTLATLTDGTYGVHFLMRLIDGKVGLLYGRAEYATQADAEAAEQPSDMPYEFHSTHATFIARLVFLKSAGTLATIMDIRPIIGGTAGTGGTSSISLPLAVNQGGTGATTAAGARTNLELNNVTNDAQLKRSAGDFNTFSEKTRIASSDVLLIEDGEDTLNKKKLFGNNLMWGDQQAITFSTNLTVSWALANTQFLTLSGNSVINFGTMVNGQVYRLLLIQDGIGSRTVSWGATIRWAGGTEPTLTTTANKADIITLLQTNNVIFADARLNF